MIICVKAVICSLEPQQDFGVEGNNVGRLQQVLAGVNGDFFAKRVDVTL